MTDLTPEFPQRDAAERLPPEPSPESSAAPTEPGDEGASLPPGSHVGAQSEALKPPEWLDEGDFIPPEVAHPEPPQPPGPGLGESFAWMGGMFGLQMLGGVMAIFVIMLLYLADTGYFQQPDEPLRDVFDQETVKLLQREYSGVLFGTVQSVSVLGVALAAWLRLGRERRRMLPLAPIPWRHVGVILLAFFPLAVLSTQLHTGATWVWTQITELLPFLKPVDQINSMTAVQELGERNSLIALLLMIAVAPAIAEELVFRGIIGRGLIARWGLRTGVLLTSLLFAAMHVHPPHAFALIPLSIFIHLTYLSTRSFCAPMLVHFLNNAFAVVILKLLPYFPEETQQMDQEPQFSVILLTCSAGCVVTLMMALWRSRMQFVDHDGSEWTPGYPAVEHPPAELEATLTARCRPTDLDDWLPAIIGLSLFLGGLILFAALAVQG